MRQAGSEADQSPRNFHTIMWYNLPVAVIYLLFDLWRVLVNQSRLSDQNGCDVVCYYTTHYGDLLPIVSSVKAKLTEAGSLIDLELARELLFFNVLIGAGAISAVVFAFIFHVRRFGLYEIKRIREGHALFGLVPVVGSFILFMTAAKMTVVTLVPQAIVLSHWSGLLLYNLVSLISSFMLMLFVVSLSEWRATMQLRFGRNSVMRGD